MSAGPKPKGARKKESRPARREEFVDYVVEITGWNWGYWLSLNAERRPIDPYQEFRYLQIRGKLLWPAGFMIDQVKVSLLTSDMSEDTDHCLEAFDVGRLLRG
jgi:hypothetical protein